jgi:hypothetical protein
MRFGSGINDLAVKRGGQMVDNASTYAWRCEYVGLGGGVEAGLGAGVGAGLYKLLKSLYFGCMGIQSGAERRLKRVKSIYIESLARVVKRVKKIIRHR